jgi:anthranilate phosphoribosyltransferase
MLNPLIEKLIEKRNLSSEDIHLFMQAISEKEYTLQIAAVLVLLRSKGEHPEEIAALAQSMRAERLIVQTKTPVIDIVGTGGDGMGTINISTGSAILAAACGIPVAKHGNRSVSSRCGSADVLESLGVVIDLTPKQVARSIEKAGIGFMFAPRFNPILASLASVRRALRVPTILNVLGSLLNPAKAPYLVYGVYQPKLVSMMAQTLQNMGIKRAVVFHGHRTDELTPIGPTKVLEVTRDQIREFVIDPLRCGLKECHLDDLKGGGPQENAHLLREVLSGQQGAIANALALNAGVGLWVYGAAASVEEGVQNALEVLLRGEAGKLLDKWIHLTRQLKEAASEE